MRNQSPSVEHTFSSIWRAWEVLGGGKDGGYNWASPGPTPPPAPLEKGPLSEGSISQHREGMCLIKIHKIVAGKTRELFHLSPSIRVCVLPGKSGLCRKNFPNGFHMPLSPKRGLLRERGLGPSPLLLDARPQCTPSAGCRCLNRRRHGQ